MVKDFMLYPKTGKEDGHFYHFNILLDVQASAIRQENEIKAIEIGEKDEDTVFIHR